MKYKEIVKKVSIPAQSKTKQKEYLSSGTLPIIDQGKFLIGGYSNDVDNELECELPVIVFGDHTKCVKYINFPFVQGADGIKVLKPKEGIYPKYLFYYTQYLTYRIEDKGYARHYQYIEKEDVLLPPLPEQERIVSRIEELFSELDNAVETLNATKSQLRLYKQAVLKDAFDGNLTNSGAPEIKELASFIEQPRYGTSKKCNYQDDITAYTEVYRIPNIDASTGTLDKSDLKYAQFDEDEIEKLSLKYGDILIIRSNGSPSIVGTAAMVREQDITGLFAGYLIRIRISDHERLSPKYLLRYLSSYDARRYIENVSKSTSGVNNVNAQEIKKIKVPYFEKEIQDQIIYAIESRLSAYVNIEKTVNQALQQASAMRQSILKQAFEGGLQ